MSIIFEDYLGNIILYCKGADSIILDRINESSKYNIILRNHVKYLISPHIGKVNEHLKRYAINGLRTLLLSKKVIPKASYEEWNQNYHVLLFKMVTLIIIIFRELQWLYIIENA